MDANFARDLVPLVLFVAFTILAGAGWRSGLHTSTNSGTGKVAAKGVRFVGNSLLVELRDGRELSVPLQRVARLQWLLQAPPEQRAKWSLEPGGSAIYWEELDDGVEISRLLAMQPLA